VLYYINC